MLVRPRRVVEGVASHERPRVDPQLVEVPIDRYQIGRDVNDTVVQFLRREPVGEHRSIHHQVEPSYPVGCAAPETLIEQLVEQVVGVEAELIRPPAECRLAPLLELGEVERLPLQFPQQDRANSRVRTSPTRSLSPP